MKLNAAKEIVASSELTVIINFAFLIRMMLCAYDHDEFYTRPAIRYDCRALTIL